MLESRDLWMLHRDLTADIRKIHDIIIQNREEERIWRNALMMQIGELGCVKKRQIDFSFLLTGIWPRVLIFVILSASSAFTVAEAIKIALKGL